MSSAMIGNLAVSLTMNTAAFQRGATLAEKRTQAMQGRFASATASVKGLGAALGAGLVAVGLTSIVSNAFEMASSLSEAAAAAGVTVEALQELRFAAEQTGASSEKLEAGLVKLSRSVAMAENGSKPLIAALKTLGLTVDDLAGKTPDQQFRVFSEAFSNTADKGQALAAAMALMGRGFAELRPLAEGGAEALDQYAEASRQAGQISTEDAQKLDELADKWARLKTQAGVATANILADVIPMAQKVGEALDATKLFFYNLGQSLTVSTADIKNAVAGMVNGIKDWITGVLGGVWDSAMVKIRMVEAAFKWLYDQVIGHSSVPDLINGIAAEMARLDAVMVAPVTAATTKAQQAFRAMSDDIRALLDRLFPDIAEAMQFKDELALVDKIADPAARGAALRALEAERRAQALARDNARRSGLPNIDFGERGGALDKGIDNLGDQIDALAHRAEISTVRIAESFKDMAQGVLGALSQLGQAIKGGGFLDILGAVVGLGLQLGSIGAFGKGISTRINGPAYVNPSRSGSGGTSIIVNPSPYFDVVVDTRIGNAAPTIMQGGATLAGASSARSKKWALA